MPKKKNKLPAKSHKRPITPKNMKDDLFVEKYLATRDPVTAVIELGYSPHSARQQAYRMLQNVDIRKKISNRFKSILDRSKIQSNDIIGQLIQTGFSDIKNYLRIGKRGQLEIFDIQHLPSELTSAISSITQRADGSLSIKLHNKIEALKQLSLIYKLTEQPMGDNNMTIEKAVFIIPGFNKDFKEAPISAERFKKDEQARIEHERKLKGH